MIARVAAVAPAAIMDEANITSPRKGGLSARGRRGGAKINDQWTIGNDQWPTELLVLGSKILFGVNP